ncbi:MAG: exodeoxyribonuclease VII small subunit [Chloroflexota bacterium]
MSEPVETSPPAPSAQPPDALGTPAAPSAEPTDAQGATVDDVARLAFDQALAELQAVVGRLEAGGLPLESSIELYERGVALHAHCARLLSQAELRVQRLVEGAGGRLAVLDLRPDDEP